MQIYFDNVIFSLQRAGGISVYWYEIVRRMIRDGVSLSAIEGVRAGENIFRQKLDIPQFSIVSTIAVPTMIARYLPPSVALPKGCIFHSSYYRIPWARDVLRIGTVYDFTYERFGSGLSRWTHSLQKRVALQMAHGVICISESTKRDLLKFVPGISDDRTRVIYLGYADEFRPLQEECVKLTCISERLKGRPYLVYIGDRSAYKNFPLAAGAVSEVAGYWLVVVGGGPLSAVEKALLDEKLGARYLHLDRLPNEELNALYNSAHALIYPSSYEGFGIPVIEAMAAGCPVIAANTSSIPEAAGDAGLLVDDISAERVAERIRSLENDSFRQSVIQRGFKNSKRFSWERCYQETIAFYREIQQKSQL